MDSDLTLGEWLEVRRESLGLTEDGLAERAACPGETIREIESDGARPSRLVAGRLAAQLDLSTEQQAAFIQWARGGGPPVILLNLFQQPGRANQAGDRQRRPMVGGPASVLEQGSEQSDLAAVAGNGLPAIGDGFAASAAPEPRVIAKPGISRRLAASALLLGLVAVISVAVLLIVSNGT